MPAESRAYITSARDDTSTSAVDSSQERHENYPGIQVDEAGVQKRLVEAAVVLSMHLHANSSAAVCRSS